jgi:WD40 repeat protein
MSRKKHIVLREMLTSHRSKRKLRTSWRWCVSIVVSGLLLAWCLSCTKKSTTPKPVEYRLYTSGPWEHANGATYIFVIDTESDSVIDTLWCQGDDAFLVLKPSPDGRYLGVNGGEPYARLYDPETLTLLHEFSFRHRMVFLPQLGLIVGASSSGIKMYDYNTFDLVDEDTLRIYHPQTLESQNAVYGLVFYYPSGPDSTGFVVFDCKERRIRQLWHRFSRSDGTSQRIIFNYHVHPDGRRVYGTSGTLDGTRLFCYDLLADSTIFEYPIFGPFGRARVSPDGKEFYFTDPGVPGIDYTPGKIFIFDADNGSLLDEISLQDLDTTRPVPQPLYAYDICFHPSLPKVYVTCGDDMRGMSTILVIDTQKREIVKWIFPAGDHFTRFVEIGPVR